MIAWLRPGLVERVLCGCWLNAGKGYSRLQSSRVASEPCSRETQLIHSTHRRPGAVDVQRSGAVSAPDALPGRAHPTGRLRLVQVSRLTSISNTAGWIAFSNSSPATLPSIQHTKAGSGSRSSNLIHKRSSRSGRSTISTLHPSAVTS